MRQILPFYQKCLIATDKTISNEVFNMVKVLAFFFVALLSFF